MIYLESIANIASILTAIAAVAAWWCYVRDGYRKRMRLENYLRQDLNENPAKHSHTTLHLMAELGMTEAEIFQAAFSSRHVVRNIKTDEATGLAAYILFLYSEKGKQMNTPRRGRAWNLLLLVPFLALFWVPFYNRIDPVFFGIPFFYWYQFLWVLLTPALTWLVYVRCK